MEFNMDPDVLINDLYQSDTPSPAYSSNSLQPFSASSSSSANIYSDTISDLDMLDSILNVNSVDGDYGENAERSFDLCNVTYYTNSVFCGNQSHPLSNSTDPILPGQSDLEGNIELELIVSVVVPILFGIIFIVGLFGNALVVIVIISNQQMKNTTNFLILNLAIADLLFIIFCVPFTATDYVLSYWPFGEIWCKMVQYLIIVTAYASVNTLVLMSFDRFLAVVFPVASISLRTEKNTLMTIAITWVIILLACLPAFLAHGLEVYTYAYEEHEVCKFKKQFNQVIFQLIFMSTSYAIPLTIICLLYFGMLFRLWTSVSAASNQALRGKKRVTRMIVVVVGVFAICWLPIQIVLVLKSLDLYETDNITTIAIQITAHVLGYMNSCINPILYAFLSENFRKGFRKVIQCKVSFGRVRGGSGIRQGGGGGGNQGIGGSRIKSRTEFKGGRGRSIDGGGGAELLVTNENNYQDGTLTTTADGVNSMNPISETTLLTTHCENGGKNSHHFIKGKNHIHHHHSHGGNAGGKFNSQYGESDIL